MTKTNSELDGLRGEITDVLMTPHQAWRGMKKIPIELIWGLEALIDKKVLEGRIRSLKDLPLSDFEDMSDDGDETWFEYIYVEDRDKAVAELEAQLKESKQLNNSGEKQ